MKKKTINHEVIEQCKITKKPINTETDRYCIIVECYGDNIQSVGFYKAEQLSSIISGNLEIVKKELSDKYKRIAGGMMNRLKGFIPSLQ